MACSREGKQFHNQYYSCPTPPQVRVTRRHHPLEGRLVEMVTGGPTKIVVRHPDGTVMRLPRAWTDADGPPPSDRTERVFTVDAMLELIQCVDALGHRT